jgi:hypothetical protein
MIDVYWILAKHLHVETRIPPHAGILRIILTLKYDKRTNTGFKGQSSVAEEASLTSKTD